MTNKTKDDNFTILYVVYYRPTDISVKNKNSAKTS